MNAKQSDRQQQRAQLMLNEPISRVIPKMAIPTIVAFIINSVYSLADTYFVSILGTNATAAVSVNASLDQLIMMAGSLLAIGANSYIARLLGEGKNQKASTVLSSAFFIAFGLGFALMLVGITFMTPMVRLLGATPTCEQYSIDYATYVLLAAPFMASSFVMNQCLRSEGSATEARFHCIDSSFVYGQLSLPMHILFFAVPTEINFYLATYHISFWHLGQQWAT